MQMRLQQRLELGEEAEQDSNCHLILFWWLPLCRPW